MGAGTIIEARKKSRLSNPAKFWAPEKFAPQMRGEPRGTGNNENGVMPACMKTVRLAAW